MRIKSVLTLSFLAAATCYQATAVADTSSNFLAGLEGVYARQKENFTTSYTAPLVLVTDTNEQSYMVDDELLMMGGILGWQWRTCRFLVGAEGSLDVHSINKARSFVFNGTANNGTSRVFEGTMLYDRGPIYAFTLRGGYFVTPNFLPYIRAGAQFSRDEGTFQVFTNINNVNQEASFISSGKQDTWGFVLGAGIEVPGMIGPSTIRVEYYFSDSQGISMANAALPISHADKFEHPKINAIKFAWIWNFQNKKNTTVFASAVAASEAANSSTNTSTSTDSTSTSSDASTSTSSDASTTSTSSDATSTTSSDTSTSTSSDASKSTSSEASGSPAKDKAADTATTTKKEASATVKTETATQVKQNSSK